MDVRYLAALRRIIAPDHLAVACIKCSITRGRKRSSQVCVLVKHMEEHCILICSEEGSHPNCTITSDSRIPVNGDFRIDVEPIGLSVPHVITATMTYKKKKLIFESNCDDTAVRFFKEISKAQENSNYRTTLPSDYLWVEVYKNNSKFFFDVNPEDEDPFDDQKATRENTVKCLMQEREDEFTVLNPFQIFTATWNVNGQAPSVALTEWLSNESLCREPPDVYAVGFQELVPLGQALASSVVDSTREKEWLQAISNGLHPKGRYRELKVVRMVGMMLAVYVEEKHMDHVSNVDSHWVRTGVMGILGNKGGVGVRLDLHSTSICFINCHLAAHAEECERRNQDFNDIRNGMAFNAMRPPKSISEHDQIYWIGDMNYRLQDTSREVIDAACATGSYSSLWEQDQLLQQQKKRKIFIGFEEGKLDFKPTYKYDIGTNDWDSSEKARTPAYCDRILWRGGNVKLSSYTSCGNILISDHKPVSAKFQSGIRVVDDSKRREIFQDLMKQLDREENEFLPNVTISDQTIAFGRVHFYERLQRSFTITNTGPVIVKFSITEHGSSGKHHGQSWLKADPYYGTLRKGETCEVTLDCHVDPGSAWKINCGREKKSKFLVLHLVNGKDYFISVDMDYQHSCFGCSLEALVRHTTPIGLMKSEDLILLEQDPEKYAEFSVPFEVPTELWVLLDYLQKDDDSDTKEIFRRAGTQVDFDKIRETLDTKSPYEPFTASKLSVAESLLLFLSSLRVPVVPFEFFKKCIDSASTYTQAKNVILELPKVHQDTFRYLTSFQKRLIEVEDIKANVLAAIFSAVMIRPENDSQLESSWDRNRSVFLYHFLVNPW